MDYCPAKSFGKGFTFLSYLEKLIIEYCQLHEISDKTFDTLKHSSLRKLTLLSSDVTNVHPSTFTSLKYLDSLDLSGNTKLCYWELYNLTVGLNFTKIKFLKLAAILFSKVGFGDK